MSGSLFSLKIYSFTRLKIIPPKLLTLAGFNSAAASRVNECFDVIVVGGGHAGTEASGKNCFFTTQVIVIY